jgi:mRNA-degrading endonuclease RelE of RelBE toxin-antitoxin system
MPGHGIVYHRKVVSEDIAALDAVVRRRIKAAIEAKLTLHPERHAKPLAHTTQRLWPLRVGDRRVVFAMRESELWALRIGRRGEVYEHLAGRTALLPSRRSRVRGGSHA